MLVVQTGGAKKPRVDEIQSQMQCSSQPLPVHQPTYQQAANSMMQPQQHILQPQSQALVGPATAAGQDCINDAGDEEDDGSEDDSSGGDESD
jgi:hypothetical protein